jgi:hypothetical protein
MGINVCDRCNEKMIKVNVPKWILDFNIPFFKRYSIQIMDWDNEEYQCFCKEEDSREEIYRQIESQAGREGYEAGFNDGRNSRF